MKGKLEIEQIESYSSRTCTGRFIFRMDKYSEGEDPDLEGLVIPIEVPDKPEWKGKQIIKGD